MARRDDREYREYLREEQRRQPRGPRRGSRVGVEEGCPAREVVLDQRGQATNHGDPEVGDIVVTDAPGVAVAVQAADCVPLLIADRRTGAVVAAHAGWRGLAGNVPRVAIDALAREFGGRAIDLVVAAGPSVGPCCYEVGADVRRCFEAAGFSAGAIQRWFHDGPKPTAANPSMPSLSAERRPEHWFFDGWTAVREELQDAGVPADQIHLATLCTASHPDVLCSYRRERNQAGRIAAAIRCAPRRP